MVDGRRLLLRKHSYDDCACPSPLSPSLSLPRSDKWWVEHLDRAISFPFYSSPGQMAMQHMRSIHVTKIGHAVLCNMPVTYSITFFLPFITLSSSHSHSQPNKTQWPPTSRPPPATTPMSPSPLRASTPTSSSRLLRVSLKFLVRFCSCCHLAFHPSGHHLFLRS